jgi:hypothetical protein
LGANLSDAASAFGGGYAAGGGTDIAVRLIGQWLSERLGRQFIPIDGKRLEKPQRPRSESG